MAGGADTRITHSERVRLTCEGQGILSLLTSVGDHVPVHAYHQRCVRYIQCSLGHNLPPKRTLQWLMSAGLPWRKHCERQRNRVTGHPAEQQQTQRGGAATGGEGLRVPKKDAALHAFTLQLWPHAAAGSRSKARARGWLQGDGRGIGTEVATGRAQRWVRDRMGTWGCPATHCGLPIYVNRHSRHSRGHAYCIKYKVVGDARLVEDMRLWRGLPTTLHSKYLYMRLSRGLPRALYRLGSSSEDET